MSRGMRPSSVLSEAARNLASGTSRAAILATIFVALVGTVAILDVRTVVDVLRNAAAYRAAGAISPPYPPRPRPAIMPVPTG